MKVMVNIDEKQFEGFSQLKDKVTRKTVRIVAQDIIDRYCNVEYYNSKELENISNNEFVGYSH